MIDDPISFEVIKNALVSATREMSQSLQRTAFSPNIKERRDCSCAMFDTEGRLVAQSKDIPVHLGAMPLSVRSCIEQLGNELSQDRMALLNDPYSGGSHLPDLTLVAPVYVKEEHVGFVANRAHHADVGGVSPGSMPGLSLSVHEEGVVIPPRIIVDKGALNKASIEDLLGGTRTPDERLGDLSAQIAANNVGIRRLQATINEHSLNRVTKNFEDMRSYSQTMMLSALSEFAGEGATFTDYMDSDGAGSFHIPISVVVDISRNGAEVSFEKTAPQVEGNINCPIASSLSSVYYAFISVFGRGIPTNEGCWSAISVSIPEGSILNPRYPAAVSAGNVETSQRIVDVVLGALSAVTPERIPAASQGTMNNLTIGGIDPRTAQPFSFYETIGGGAGAGKNSNGQSGIHTHMTNTLNTPVEALEIAYPLRVLSYSLRQGSGGKGASDGGAGIVRAIELLGDDFVISIQSERRDSCPWGLNGGQPAKQGRNILIYDKKEYVLQSKTTVKTLQNAIVRIETPGGGGWGCPSL
jgi:N-methylhydantoinase B